VALSTNYLLAQCILSSNTTANTSYVIIYKLKASKLYLVSHKGQIQKNSLDCVKPRLGQESNLISPITPSGATIYRIETLNMIILIGTLNINLQSLTTLSKSMSLRCVCWVSYFWHAECNYAESAFMLLLEHLG
jgi:hypothetical protein